MLASMAHCYSDLTCALAVAIADLADFAAVTLNAFRRTDMSADSAEAFAIGALPGAIAVSAFGHPDHFL